MNEKQVALMIMLDNYNNGNKWISQLDIQDGYEVIKDGVKHIYYTNLSRRVTDIKIHGKTLYIDKIKNFNGTNYTCYRLTPNMNDIDLLSSYIKGNLKPIKKNKSLFDKIKDMF